MKARFDKYKLGTRAESCGQGPWLERGYSARSVDQEKDQEPGNTSKWIFCYCFGTLVDSRFRTNHHTIWGSNQRKINQREIWRHKVFFHGSCEENTNQSKLKLTNVDKFVGFSNDQIIKMIISFLQRFTEDHDYASHLLLPELIELLLINIFTM